VFAAANSRGPIKPDGIRHYKNAPVRHGRRSAKMAAGHSGRIAVSQIDSGQQRACTANTSRNQPDTRPLLNSGRRSRTQFDRRASSEHLMRTDFAPSLPEKIRTLPVSEPSAASMLGGGPRCRNGSGAVCAAIGGG
jgi:hypothetical protein